MDDPAEIVALRATVRTALPRRAEEQSPDTRLARPARSCEAFSFRRGERLAFALVDRTGLAPGDVLRGPAIVVEQTATTYLDAGYAARVHASGCLLIEREAA
jgi:N-methylhydantoinase A